MRWCCAGFSNNVQMAGERGFSVIVEASENAAPEFIVQHRAVNLGTEFPVVSDVAISLVSDMRIAFCPWCGVSLGAFYGNSAKEIARNDLRVRIDGL
jgi:hypothetical protein